MVFDPQLLVEFSECIVVEFFASVQDEDTRIPKQKMMLFQMKPWTFFSIMVAKGSTSTHFMK